MSGLIPAGDTGVGVGVGGIGVGVPDIGVGNKNCVGVGVGSVKGVGVGNAPDVERSKIISEIDVMTASPTLLLE